MPATYALPLTTLGTISATATTPGTNVLNWAVPPTTGAGDPQTFAWRALFLQRSVNVDVPGPFGPYVFNHVTTLSALNHRLVPGVNGRWNTIRTWTTAELPQGSWPLQYSESVPHTTWYYYRLIYMARSNADGTGTGIQYEWNHAYIVQPGVLAGTKSGDSPTHLTWDAPLLVDPNFSFTITPSTDPACGNPVCKWALRWTWPFVTQPSSYVLSKSYDGTNYYLAATLSPSFTQPFYDNDQHATIYYKMQAHATDGFISTYDVQSVGT